MPVKIGVITEWVWRPVCGKKDCKLCKNVDKKIIFDRILLRESPANKWT